MQLWKGNGAYHSLQSIKKSQNDGINPKKTIANQNKNARKCPKTRDIPTKQKHVPKQHITKQEDKLKMVIVNYISHSSRGESWNPKSSRVLSNKKKKKA